MGRVEFSDTLYPLPQNNGYSQSSNNNCLEANMQFHLDTVGLGDLSLHPMMGPSLDRLETSALTQSGSRLPTSPHHPSQVSFDA